eukprot:scaffold84483_cov20-Prasinocladus_malaysianus.AAC.1
MTERSTSSRTDSTVLFALTVPCDMPVHILTAGSTVLVVLTYTRTRTYLYPHPARTHNRTRTSRTRTASYDLKPQPVGLVSRTVLKRAPAKNSISQPESYS